MRAAPVWGNGVASAHDASHLCRLKFSIALTAAYLPAGAFAPSVLWGVFAMRMTVVLTCWMTWLPLLLAGTQHGQLLCVQGAGVPRPALNGVEYGHHYFEVIVQVPSAAEATQNELQLLQELATVVQQQHGRLHRGRPAQQPQQQQGADGVQQMQDHARHLVTNTVKGGQLDGQQGGQDLLQQQQQQTQDAAAGSGQHFLDPP